MEIDRRIYMYDVVEREFIRCADCHNRAIVRVKSGWTKKINNTIKPEYVNLCPEHYNSRHLNTAQKWCHDNGLDTEDKRKDYVFKTPFKFKTI